MNLFVSQDLFLIGQLACQSLGHHNFNVFTNADLGHCHPVTNADTREKSNSSSCTGQIKVGLTYCNSANLLL